MTRKNKIVILGSGISGVGAAQLVKKWSGYFSFGIKKYQTRNKKNIN